ncbi:MAG: thermonuclease family protein [Alphaproteobacteria bacterium]|nr:thermonuclease family protein [Alphaproteobacteria bacterium]
MSAPHDRIRTGRPLPWRLLAAGAVAVGIALAVPDVSLAEAEVISGEARVIDGDTLSIAGRRIRLHGIDAPETRQTCRRHGRRWACGKAATRAMRRLVGRDPVRCEVRDRDRHGRAVAVCFAAGRDLQRELVRQGLALAYRRYSTRHVPEEDAARRERAGLWSGEFTEPWRWRREARERRRSVERRPQTAPGSCLIKGNISRNGRIYHVPGGQHYDRTRIDASRGERWFCTEAGARAAGWRRAGR